MRSVALRFGTGDELLRAPADRERARVSSPGNALEVEADRMARTALAASRRPADADAVRTLPAQRDQPLPASLRREMEAGFSGVDFSDVRLHRDADAARSAAALHASAYTSGGGIVLGAPPTRSLIAHELACRAAVARRGAGGADPAPADGAVGHTGGRAQVDPDGSDRGQRAGRTHRRVFHDHAELSHTSGSGRSASTANVLLIEQVAAALARPATVTAPTGAFTVGLADAGIEPSVGSRGDSYDNALAETINGLYKAELIHRRAPWKTTEAVELATLEWVSWFNHHRLLEPIGHIPPAEAEPNDYRQLAASAMPA